MIMFVHLDESRYLSKTKCLIEFKHMVSKENNEIFQDVVVIIIA